MNANETVAVGCRYCGWISHRIRKRLERDKLVACEWCRALVSSSDAQAAGEEIETRRSEAFSPLQTDPMVGTSR